MTEMTSSSAADGVSGSPTSGSDAADLPRQQGLEDTETSADGGTDPHGAADAARGLGTSPGESSAGSDPMPDMSGTGGS